MDENVFIEKLVVPDGKNVLKALGEMGGLWLELRKYIQENYGPAIEEWKYYGPESGWTMKFVLKRKNLFFFNAMSGGFRVSFTFSEKAAVAIEQSDLPREIIDRVKSAPRHADGRGLSIEVRNQETAELAKRLVEIKMENQQAVEKRK